MGKERFDPFRQPGIDRRRHQWHLILTLAGRLLEPVASSLTGL